MQCASVPLVPIRDGISTSQPIPGPAIESCRAVCFGNRHPISSFRFSRRFSSIFLSFIILSRRSETERLDFLEDLSCRTVLHEKLFTLASSCNVEFREWNRRWDQSVYIEFTGRTNNNYLYWKIYIFMHSFLSRANGLHGIYICTHQKWSQNRFVFVINFLLCNWWSFRLNDMPVNFNRLKLHFFFAVYMNLLRNKQFAFMKRTISFQYLWIFSLM